VPSIRSALETPELEGSLKTKSIMLTAAFAALYAVLVFIFAGISYGMVQVRIADALIPLSIVLGWPVVLGVAIGCAIANIATPLPSVATDVTLGSVANFIASLLAWRISRWKSGRVGELFGCLAATLTVTLIVGTYLAAITAMNYWIWWIGVGIGSIISITVVGFILVTVLRTLKIR
jgi:uncharacterized membrane protein